MLRGSGTDLLGKSVVNGCGALLGEVVGLHSGPHGEVEELVVRQRDGIKEWLVEAYNVKAIRDAEVHLKGPREGYHIAPLPPLGLPPA